jgi:hypothetical protein
MIAEKIEQKAIETTERYALCFLGLLCCLALFDTQSIGPFNSVLLPCSVADYVPGGKHRTILKRQTLMEAVWLER